MKKRESGWQIIVYNLKRKIKVSGAKFQTFIFCKIQIRVFWDRATFYIIFKTLECSWFYENP